MSILYKTLVRPHLFNLDPETAHNVASMLARPLNNSVCANALRELMFVKNPVKIANMTFSNPVVLAAGFDKDCKNIGLWKALGFSGVEVGTVTVIPQVGNPRPRVFRLSDDSALINRMGFPGSGLQVVKPRLEKARAQFRDQDFLIGVNIGKGKDTPQEEAAKDYVRLLKEFEPLVDWITVNVSSPNTPGLRLLQRESELEKILSEVLSARTSSVPVFVKVSQDQSEGELEAVANVVKRVGISGIIPANTSVTRRSLSSPNYEKGGLSGKPIFKKCLDTLFLLKGMLGDDFPIIGAGGVHSREDAEASRDAGAKLLQIYTGFIYEGPSLVRQIARVKMS